MPAAHTTGAVMDCYPFVDSGCLGYLLAATSSDCPEMREAGYHCLLRFVTHVEGSRFREKGQVWTAMYTIFWQILVLKFSMFDIFVGSWQTTTIKCSTC